MNVDHYTVMPLYNNYKVYVWQKHLIGSNKKSSIRSIREVKRFVPILYGISTNQQTILLITDEALRICFDQIFHCSTFDKVSIWGPYFQHLVGLKKRALQVVYT